MSGTVINTRLPVSCSPERLAEIESDVAEQLALDTREPISYTEFKRRLDAANAEMNGQKVLLEKAGAQPTKAEFAKQRSALERHGIVDFELSWDVVARRFTLGAKGETQKP